MRCDDPCDIDVALQAAAFRYRSLGRSAGGWANGKLRHDPVYAAVLTRLPERGHLVDLGCGEGYLLAAAQAYRPALTLCGVDHDERRLRHARAIFRNTPGVQLATDDVRCALIPPASVVTLIDVLHYVPIHDQDALLRKAAEALDPGGLLLVRDIEPRAGVASLLATTAERLARLVGRHRGDGLFFRSIVESERTCRAAGMETTMTRCDRGTPFATPLLAARRRAPTIDSTHG